MKLGSKHAAAPIFTLLLLFAPVALGSNTWYVNGASGSDNNDCKSSTTACKTIGHAIALAASGDSITIGKATYKEQLTIAVSLTIVGSGAAKTIIDGEGAHDVLYVSNSGANVSLSKVTVRNGYSQSGGGIYNQGGTLAINNSVITANWAHRACDEEICANFGGGIVNNQGTLTLNHSSVIGNKASLYAVLGGTYSACSRGCAATGGGIWSSGTLVINSSTVSGNSAIVSCGIGHCVSGSAGVSSGGYGTTTTINGSTISGNTAQYAGGIGNSYGTLTLTNSTLSGNIAFADGGGISSSGTVLINNSTISGNNAGSSGGGVENSGSITFQNSIVADNGSGNCDGGNPTSNGYNLSSDGTCNFNSPGDLNNTDPQLGPLRHNGGPTQTMVLPSGSPAIDAGNPKGCTDSNGNLLKTDQRGKPRSDPEDSGGCDIGAYESQTD